ncbi:fused MFS/spermidine synthase [bacterium]|nr:fused MFS/spermidine synthase [bacterium]
MKSWHTLLIYTLFFFSGAFALIYQLCWVKAITLEFGSTTLAVSTVVAVFMGGLALGSFIISKKVDRIAAPLTLYGKLELAIALYALLTPLIFKQVLPLFSLAGIGISDNLIFLFIVRFIIAALLLLGPTVLMGTTLPLLTQFYVNKKTDAAKKGGILYGINTIGAFAGTLTAGFILLPGLGLAETVYGIALLNGLVGISAILAGKRIETAIPHHTVPAKTPKSGTPGRPTLVSLAVALTGFAGLACEILWTRTVILVIGGSTYAFSIVLATFLAGLGLGSAIISAVLKSERAEAIKIFYILSLLTAVLVAVTTAVFKYLPWLFIKMYWAFQLDRHPEKIFFIQVFIAGIILFYPAFIMGGLFPAAIRIVKEQGEKIGRKIGQLYAWNTVGSILGSLAAGFILVPLFGMRTAFLIIIALYCLAGVLITALRSSKIYLKHGIILSGTIALLLIILLPEWNRVLMTAGAYRRSTLNALMRNRIASARDLEEGLTGQNEILYYKDGLTSTVTVKQTPLVVNGIKHRVITVDGKAEGSSIGDMPTQRLSAHFPLLIHPDPKTACVIGMGTGCTAGSASLYPLTSTTVVEIEPAVVEAARFFKDHNYDLHENPNVDIRVTDGRLFLKLHPDRFDVIISEPSNPWMAGVANLFTREYFELCFKALKQEGIICQWCQLYSISQENLKTMIRTFTAVFPNVYVVSSIQNTDILLLGSKQPLVLEWERIRERMSTPEIAADLADSRVQITSIYELLARVRMGPAGTELFAGDGPLNTDNHTVVSYRAPKDMYRKVTISYDSSMTAMNDPVGNYISFNEAIPGNSKQMAKKLDRYYADLYSTDKGRNAQ